MQRTSFGECLPVSVESHYWHAPVPSLSTHFVAVNFFGPIPGSLAVFVPDGMNHTVGLDRTKNPARNYLSYA